MGRTVANDDQQRRFWDDHASTYDRGMALVERRILRDTRSWVAGRATGQTLEVAVGTGLNLPHYSDAVELTAVDLSPQMLKIARRRAADLERTVTFSEQSASALGFADDSFDTVTCTLALCSIPDDKGAVAEMIRVLRPGGQLILADHVESSAAALRLGQRLLELWSLRDGEHFRRRPIRHLYAAGVQVHEHERFLGGIIERVVAIKPADH